MKPSVIEPVYKSIIRRVTDMIDDLNALGQFRELTWHNFESRNDENELPQTTLIGLDGFSFDENQGLWIIRVALGISSYRDLNLLEEIELINAIHSHIYEGAKVPLLEMDNGDEVNELVVTNFVMLPMAQSELRNYRTIGLEIKRTAT
jgi:hypothetical protein